MKNADMVYALFVSLHVRELTMNRLKFLLAPLGIGESTIRSTLSRLHAKDLIGIERNGRTARYFLGSRGKRIGANIGRHFREPDWTGWNGEYWGAAFSGPDGKTRYGIRKKLTAYRFRPLYPGLWIRPLNRRERISASFSGQVRAGGFDLFVCRFRRPPTPERIARLYDLETVGAALSRALAEAGRSLDTAASLSPERAFEERMILGDELVHALAADPLLPPVLLPDAWPGSRLRAVFYEWNRVLAERCEPFVRSALESGTPDPDDNSEKEKPS